MEHVDIPLGEIHKPHNYEYADAAARLAAVGFVAADVGKLALQLSDMTYWILSAATPAWAFAGEVAVNSVTNAKLADVATATIKGRITAAPGDPEDLTAAQVRTLLSIGNVDNTSDAGKPVSTAQAAADTAATNAAKAYADGLVVGLWDDRGVYDASVNTYPAAGGSGTAGAVLKGDIWTVSVAGTLGGAAVAVGDTVRAVIDTPAQVAANWAVLENNIGYVPENATNKDASGGYAGLIGQAVKIWNAAKTFYTTLASTSTANRAINLPDKDGTVAMISDITGTNSGTNTGDQTITLTGDVTGTGTGSFVATIAADAVTYAKIQNVTTARLLGRATAAAGDAEEITLGTGLSFTGTTLNAAGGSTSLAISQKTAAYTVVAGDNGTVINCPSGTFTLTLTAAATLGTGFNVRLNNQGTGLITVATNGVNLLAGGITSLVISPGVGYFIFSDGVDFFVNSFSPFGGGVTRLQIGSGATCTGTDGIAVGRGASSGFGIAIGANTIGSNGVAVGGNANALSNGVAVGGNANGALSGAALGIGAWANTDGAAVGRDANGGSSGAAVGSYAAGSSSGVAVGRDSFGQTDGVAVGRLSNGANNGVAIGRNASSNGQDAAVALGHTSIARRYRELVKSADRAATTLHSWSMVNWFGDTADAVATELLLGGTAAQRCVILNNSAFQFSMQIIAGVTGAGDTSSWTITGAIKRGATAASTVLVGTPTVAMTGQNTGAAAWAVAVTADTTNGSLNLTVTGAAAVTIRWNATATLSEMGF